MNDTLKVFCDPLGSYVQLPAKPRRVVSLASGLTEALVHMGYGAAIAGISEFCPRYVPQLTAPIVGDYLTCDEALLRSLQPDLLILTTGVQRRLAHRLHQAEYPVYLLPLPNSLHGVLENVLLLGALMDDMPAARALVETWNRTFTDAASAAPSPRPRVYTELWFGRHARMAGSLTFVHDLVSAAGGENIFADARTGYLDLDLAEVARRQPDIFLCFSEPEYPVTGQALQAERGWRCPVIQADVDPQRNLIHDGPSMMAVVQWLSTAIRAG
ncbi:MAG: ABC transporter substrate-binding protein [Anaerolineae bacterium]|nr:ABC transporter substrate-binding protein [Anaerolineae bacterium]